MEPRLLAPDEGEVIEEAERRAVRIKADLPELAVTESRYAPGESGPGAHVHREHCDCFWVLEGQLTFELGAGDRVAADAGGFVLVPPHLVHTFRNEGPGDARFLNFHAPSKGFADHLRAMRDGATAEEAADRFDTFDPPSDGGLPASAAVIRPAGEGERLQAGASSVVFKAQSDDGIHALSLTESVIAPGFPGPVAHHHESLVDSFYVLEGALTVRLGDETLQASAGSYALVPAGNVHTFSNPGERPVRSLNLMAPGGLEQYLKEVAAATAPGTPPDPALMAGIASRYDFHPAG